MFTLKPNIILKTLRLPQFRALTTVDKELVKDIQKENHKQPIVSHNQEQQNSNANLSSHNNSQDGRLDDLYRYLWLKCSAHQTEVLDSYEKFVKLAAKNLDIECVKTESPFRLIKRRTLLASRHVHKKYRVQYETRNYYRNLQFKNLTGSTLETFLEYVERNLPEGVLLIAEKHKLSELPFDLVDDSSDIDKN